MAFYNFQKGIGNVGSYLISSIPFLSSSLDVPGSGSEPIKVRFPHISSFVTVKNDTPGNSGSAPLRFGFSAKGTKGGNSNKQNYIVLYNGESFTGDFRVSEVYLVAHTSVVSTGSVAAGMTGIRYDELEYTGGWNNWTGSDGVG